MAHYVVIRSTDNKNVGRTFPNLPKLGDPIELSTNYSFEPSLILEIGTGLVVVANANYIMHWKRRD